MRSLQPLQSLIWGRSYLASCLRAQHRWHDSPVGSNTGATNAGTGSCLCWYPLTNWLIIGKLQQWVGGTPWTNTLASANFPTNLWPGQMIPGDGQSLNQHMMRLINGYQQIGHYIPMLNQKLSINYRRTLVSANFQLKVQSWVITLRSYPTC